MPHGRTYDSTGRLAVAAGATPVASQNGLRFDASGNLCIVDGTGAVNNFVNGLPFDSSGNLMVNSSGTAVSYQNGLPFDSGGRLVADGAGAIVSNQNGWPMSATGVAMYGLGYLTGGVNLYLSQAAYDAYLADSRPTGADKALAGAAVKSAADLTALGVTDSGAVNLSYTAKDGTLATKTSGTVPVVAFDRGATQNGVRSSHDLSSATWAQGNASLSVSVGSIGQVLTTTAATTNNIRTSDQIPGTAFRSIKARLVGVGAASEATIGYYTSTFVATNAAILSGPGVLNSNSGAWGITGLLPGVVTTVLLTTTAAVPQGDIYIYVGTHTHQSSAAGLTLGVDGVGVAPGTGDFALLRTSGASGVLYTAGTPRSQNLANGSGTQSITVVSGCVYSILHQAGGTYTLSGATTGTTTAGTTTTFVAASGTLTLTASSTPTLLQVWEGSASMAYVAGPYSEYPQRGIIDRGAATNVIKGSAAQWTARGTATKADATDTQVGAYLQLRGLAAISANDVYQTASGLTVSAACQPGLWIRRITATGQLNIADPTAVNGSWGIDLSRLPPYWVWINRNSPYITAVSAEFVANGSGANGLHFYRGSGASALDVDIAIPTLISAANADAPDLGIPTTTAAVTRSACQIMLPSSYIADAGQMTVWGGSMVNPTDGNPEIVVGRTANGRVIYAAGQWARIYDGTTVTGAQSIGYGPQIIATRYGSGAQAASLNGGSVATGAYDGTMGSGSSVGLGHDGSGGSKFVGDHYFLKIGPPPANDATLQLAASGGV